MQMVDFILIQSPDESDDWAYDDEEDPMVIV